MTTTLTLLGATGSIGASTLKVLEANPDHFSLEAVTAQSNVEALAALAKHYGARVAAIGDETKYAALKAALSGTDIECLAGAEGVVEAASRKVDVTVAAIVGVAGLKPTLAAVKNGGRIALANKECLVAAGELFMREVRSSGAELIPIDSEHNAIFQVFDKQATHITLTASGGPFRTWSVEQMARATPQEALKHPKWNMGAKISIDSATMMNKALEIIEAHYLFALPSESIEVLVHPESIVHGLVHYADGSVLAQLSSPDMATPIAHALGLPTRLRAPTAPLKLTQLNFELPDKTRFPALTLARTALKAGAGATLVLNAANEVAVAAFLEGKIGFLDIVRLCQKAISTAPIQAPTTLEAVLEVDAEVRKQAGY